MAQAVGSETTSYWWKPNGGAARVVWGEQTGYPATAFEQTNLELAREIRESAVGALGDLEGKKTWDLYGGVGDTAEILASRGAEVWSVDSDRRAVEWGRRRSREDSGATLRVHRIDDRVEDVVSRLPRPDLVVVNPPRGGLAESLVRWLRRWGEATTGARMTYVSCDPATLARDLSRLQVFRLVKLVAYDLFPNTGHLETLTVLEAA
jgi:tRNA/tmRNA/rRNA uracil-C5-methylase (TrmA/RlmC/RlmD family)